MVGWIVGGAVVLLLIVFIIVTYNSLVKKRNSCEEAFATMDVYLKQRWDYVPNLVETVKGYMKHESELLHSLTNLRIGSYDKMTTSEKIEANKQISQGLGKILAVAEAYPDLKASANFKDLNDKLENMESHIANSRKYYNASVLEYNNTVQVFPKVIIAKMFGFNKMQMFEIASEERDNVKVKF